MFHAQRLQQILLLRSVAEGADLGHLGPLPYTGAPRLTPAATTALALNMKSRFHCHRGWRSALIECRYKSFPLRLAQLSLGRFHIARRLLAKQNRAEFVSLIVARGEFLLRVSAVKLNTRRQHAEIANEIHP